VYSFEATGALSADEVRILIFDDPTEQEDWRLRQIGPLVDKQTVRRHFDGYDEEEYPDQSGAPDRIFIGQCETTLVQGPETNVRDSSGGKSS
jgi:hypothetical protein